MIMIFLNFVLMFISTSCRLTVFYFAAKCTITWTFVIDKSMINFYTLLDRFFGKQFKSMGDKNVILAQSLLSILFFVIRS